MNCIALDQNSKRCRRKAVGLFEYHGDPEMYSGGLYGDQRPVWVVAPLCKEHGEKLTEYKTPNEVRE